MRSLVGLPELPAPDLFCWFKDTSTLKMEFKICTAGKILSNHFPFTLYSYPNAARYYLDLNYLNKLAIQSFN